MTFFIIMLALTGLGILWNSLLEGRGGEQLQVTIGDQVQPVSLQAQAAQAAFPTEKWNNTLLSDKTHAKLNPGYKLMPWAIEPFCRLRATLTSC
nr:hypothetical protein [uncultured Cohaesibacter sp.]